MHQFPAFVCRQGLPGAGLSGPRAGCLGSACFVPATETSYTAHAHCAVYPLHRHVCVVLCCAVLVPIAVLLLLAVSGVLNGPSDSVLGLWHARCLKQEETAWPEAYGGPVPSLSVAGCVAAITNTNNSAHQVGAGVKTGMRSLTESLSRLMLLLCCLQMQRSSGSSF